MKTVKPFKTFGKWAGLSVDPVMTHNSCDSTARCLEKRCHLAVFSDTTVEF